MKTSAKARARAFKFAVSMLALAAGAGMASPGHAQDAVAPAAPDGAWDLADIIGNNNMPPLGNPPGGTLDNTDNLTGVGMMTVRASPLNTGFTACSGTLINPRTVIFNAHCVNTRPASAYGFGHGTAFGPWANGTPIAFGFQFDNLPGLLGYFGLVGGGALTHRTNEALFIYNAEHVWYDPRSLAPSSAGFLEADIAIATLDTPAFDVPTWVLLFSPLQEATHGVVTGYGGNGTAATVHASPCPLPACGASPIDFRRRAAENMISFLGSLDDRNDFLFGPSSSPINPQALYQTDFDSPAGEAVFNPGAALFDFDLFNGAALPREATTTGGDSGGPLIADEYFDTPVVVGTLSGGSRFFGNAATPVALRQRFAEYGTSSFYQPLFLFWDQIVANNNYVYASNFDGDAAWTDPSHWIQDMDPAYGIEVDGELVSGLPGTPALGVSGATSRFGEVCFLATCVDNADDPEAQPWSVGTPNTIFIPGGPGSTDFVPNNIIANPAAGIRPRYYDVNLGGIGTTWLDSGVTIDRFTMSNGHTTLDVQSGGTLSVLGDATIGTGLLNVDGQMNSGEMLLVQGIITGTGTINPTFLTSVAGAIAPGGADVGTLTIQGDVVLASASQYFIEVGSDGADQIHVTADPVQGTLGNIMLGGDLRMVKAAHGPAPRHGQVFTIVLADGSVISTFDQVYAQTGILRPLMIYNPSSVDIELRAGLFADVIEDSGHNLSFANALDQLRDGSYNLLWNLYGELDVMDISYLSTAFASLSPVSLFDAHGLMAMQDSSFATTLQERMALLSREGGSGLGFSMMGAPGQLFAFGGDDGLAAAPELAFASALTQSTHVTDMPNGVSAFFSGGYSDARASSTTGRSAESVDDGLRTWQMVGGIEQTFGAFTVGVGAGYSRGSAAQQGFGALAENELAQTAVYGVYRLDNGMYVSGLVGAGMSRVDTERRFATGLLDYHLAGNIEGDLYLASVEGGWNLDITSAMTLTPNASVRHYVLRTGAYAESGGDAALAVAEQLFERSEARLGLRLAGDAPVFGWRLSPTLDAALVANLSGEEGGVWAHFAAAPDVSFYLPGALRDDYWGEVVGGLRLVRGDTSFALRLETSVGREEQYEDRYVARFARRF